MKIDCDLKKNWGKNLCKKAVGEGKYSIVLPKFDNSGKRINSSVHKKYVRRMNERFFGSTTNPNVLGCFESSDKRIGTRCESNIIINSVRDFEGGDLNSNQRKRKLKEDFNFMKKLGKQAGKEFGQESVLVQFDNVRDVTFVPGRRVNKLSSKKLRKEDLFSDSI